MSKIVDVRASPQSWPFSGDFGHFGPDAKAGRDHAAVRIVNDKGRLGWGNAHRDESRTTTAEIATRQ
jgi:hypothetical protein